jgi:pentatricopeptide repeat protein
MCRRQAHRRTAAEGIEPELYSYSALIDCFSKSGRVNRAFALLNEMKERDIKPNTVGSSSISRSCELNMTMVLLLVCYNRSRSPL